MLARAYRFYATHSLTEAAMKYLRVIFRIIIGIVVVLVRIVLVPLRAIAGGTKYVRTVDACQQHYQPPRIPFD